VSVDHVRAVPAPPAAVWSEIADPTQRPAWMTELRAVDAAPGDVQVGDRFAGASSILGHEFLGESRITDVDPGRLLAEDVVIGARFTSRWELTASADGASTTVRHAIDVQFPAGPFSGLERWVLRRRLLRMQRQSLANLAARLGS
jgi:uncharacterized protein YndB with AHSA1/START domain